MVQTIIVSGPLSGGQINVSNLFDHEYYTSCSYNIYCQFGNRRQWLAGVRYSW
jgi:iron complex outermembrane receptor protein